MHDTDNRVYGNDLVTERGLRFMARWGWFLTALWVLIMVACAVIWPEPYRLGWLLVLELFFVGRTVCAYEGIRLGFHKAYLMMQAGIQDIAFFLVIFPLFARFYERVARDRAIDRLLRRLVAATERKCDSLRAFGLVGLFLFVFLPVSGTGTLVGCVAGYLLGYRIRILVPLIFTAHLSSLILLLAFFDWLAPTLTALNEDFARYFAWTLPGLVIGGGWIYSVVQKRMAQSRERGSLRDLDPAPEPAE